MENKIGIKLYFDFIKRYAFKKKLYILYLIVIIIIIITALISLVRPQLQGKVIDDLSNPESTTMSAFMMLLLAFLGILLINYIMSYIQKYVVLVISEEIAADMRQKIQDKLATVRVDFFEQIELSDILLRIDKDVSTIKQCGITSIMALISNVAILIVVSPYMISIHKGVAIANIFLLISVPFISKLLGNMIQQTSAQVLAGYNEMTNVLTNTYDNWFAIRLYRCGQYIHNRYHVKNCEYKEATNRQNLLCVLNTLALIIIQFAGTVIIWVVGAREVFEGNMSIGIIMALMNYQTIIMNPIIEIAQFVNEYHTAIVSLKDINLLLLYPDIVQNSNNLGDIDEVRLENVSYRYPQTKKMVFESINLSFCKGRIYGIRGQSGQGKTTLFNLIAGIYKPTSGKIMINNCILDESHLTAYWEMIGFVMQRTHFFQDSLRNNLGMIHTVTDQEMDVLAECLDLYDEIHCLSAIWDTVVKTDPCNFSEGQMRRLDIMRTILKKPRLLIFDEATANIDKRRRVHFYHLLHELSTSKIILFTTHNQDELKEADEIIDLERLNLKIEKNYFKGRDTDELFQNLSYEEKNYESNLNIY